jgi:cleavage and polyadenylation specificity factor subunit 3
MSSVEQPKEVTELMTITPLGGGQEVGRSCIMLNYQGRTIMLDCGTHPGRRGESGLPFFDTIDHPEEIDLILITHFHIDHCAALPYFTERYPFKGRIFATHATKAVMKLLLSDNIKLQNDENSLYTEQVIPYFFEFGIIYCI